MNVMRKNDGYVKFYTLPVGKAFETKKREVFMKTELISSVKIGQVNAISFDGRWEEFDDEAMVKPLDAEVVVKN